MNFFFAQNRSTDVYSLTETLLKERLDREFGPNAASILAAYRRGRPDESPASVYVAITSARFAGIGSTTIAERKYTQRGAPVYSYLFTHESDRLIPGTQHASAPRTRPTSSTSSTTSCLPGERDNRRPRGRVATRGRAACGTARNMSELWSAFARTGRPAAQGQPAWPAYTTERRATMFIDADCRIVDDPFSLERQVWDGIDE